MRFRPNRIISGGQTGADRAALDAALELGISHGGVVPRGRKAEDGTISLRYRLTEIESPCYAVRTERNVLEADATVVFTRGKPTGGSGLTAGIARKHQRPVLVVDLADEPQPAKRLSQWLEDVRPETLNVAGSRESGAPGIYDEVRRTLLTAFD